MCDKLVYDLSQEVEGTPNIFIRKDWINIMDNMNGNYQSNQSIIDTSQLSNSNKWMSYREAYIVVPMVLTAQFNGTAGAQAVKMGDYAQGLKNWFGTIIHSLTLDYNGTTIIQQTPFINMWNIFKLLTSLSYGDVATMGSTIGFYPDNFNSFTIINNGQGAGMSIKNNNMASMASYTSNLVSNMYDAYYLGLGGNEGLTMRTKWISYDPTASTVVGDVNSYYNNILPQNNATQVWKSFIYQNTTVNAGVEGQATQQIAVTAIIYLRHLAAFFNMIPLLKGVFMKLTLNLNNATSTATFVAGAPAVTTIVSNVPVGGVNPLLIPSDQTGSQWVANVNNGFNNTTIYNLSVGNKCLGNGYQNNTLLNSPNAQNIYLYVPAYSFNPTFEEAYLSSSPKTIRYTDVYQYQVLNQTGNINALVTNGIANIKSVLIIPFLTTMQIGTNGIIQNEWQSPFDTAGCGTTAPLISLTNFNIQISGQNAIYNTQRYNYEEFVNQLYGENAVNGGLTDGLTSGLIDFLAFQNSACYYYVNVERMLPVEKSVPKSVQIIGTNNNNQIVGAGNNANTYSVPINLWVFIEYETEVRIDLYTGARI